MFELAHKIAIHFIVSDTQRLREQMDLYTSILVNDAWQQLQQDSNIVLVDIRDSTSFATAHPPKAQHLTEANFAEIFDPLEFDQPIFVLCYHGISSQKVAQHLIYNGFENVVNITGGFAAWQQAGLPVEKKNPC